MLRLFCVFAECRCHSSNPAQGPKSVESGANLNIAVCQIRVFVFVAQIVDVKVKLLRCLHVLVQEARGPAVVNNRGKALAGHRTFRQGKGDTAFSFAQQITSQSQDITADMQVVQAV